VDAQAFLGLVEQVDGELPNIEWYQFGQDGQIQERALFTEPLADARPPTQIWIATFVPPGFPLLFAATIAFAEDGAGPIEEILKQTTEFPGETAMVAALVLLQGIVGVVLAIWGSRQRQLGKNTTWCWLLIGFLLGPVGALTLLAVYPRILREECGHCRKPTDRGHSTCESCCRPLDRFKSTGIEILDTQSSVARVAVAN
jgi:hypothetical protein